MADDPVEIFQRLLQRASQSCAEPEAMVVSTVDADGRPSGRHVLLKAFDQRGFVFYANLNSPKARALSAHPYASLCFYWAAIGKQVRVEGPVERVSDVEADAYFATRPRESQLGAWTSDHSATLESRALLDQRVDQVRASFEGRRVPRPPCWSGFRVMPQAVEFWTRDPARLHERERYQRDGIGGCELCCIRDAAAA